MGIDYEAAIMVGLPRGDIECEDIADLIYEEELEVCPPYYDGSDDDGAIVGLTYKVSGTYQASEFKWDQTLVDALKTEFKKLTGQDAKVWLSPLGW